VFSNKERRSDPSSTIQRVSPMPIPRTWQPELTDSESLRDTRQIPHRLNSKLGDRELAKFVNDDLAVHLQSAFFDGILELRQAHMRLGDGDGGSDLHALLVNVLLVEPRGQMTVRVHGNDLLGVGPLRERANSNRGLSVCEVGFVVGLELVDS
jgi:hypothetical protein